jgi:hypothetical protein
MTRPTAWADLIGLIDGPARGDHATFLRLQLALASARLVYTRDACFTRYGATYFAVPYRRWG